MQLADHQNQALKNIVNSYREDKDAVFIVMPPGTGKTLLSAFLVKEFANYPEIKSIAYISRFMALRENFGSIYDSIGVKNGLVKTFSIFEFKYLIKEGKVQQDEFQLIIIDDYSGTDQQENDLIFDFFKCFKVFFSGDELKKKELKDPKWSNISFYHYTIKQAIHDDYLIKSQKVDSLGILDALKEEVIKIEIGANWSIHQKKLMLDLINYASKQNDDFLQVQELIRSGKIEIPEIMEISRKKDQLEEFRMLLNDDDYFNGKLIDGKRAESVWQNYFESNPWIFGFGLNYIFNSPLEGKGLEQTVAGYSVTGHGKRTDALLRTTGLIQTLCFGEIKTHQKTILKDIVNPYRSESWAISDELAGGIAQVQRTIQKSLMNISEALSIPDEKGFTSNNPIYLYKPKSFLIIGSLNEFRDKHGNVHKHKFSSFELFRRSITDIEIITFDELYQRANALVNKKW